MQSAGPLLIASNHPNSFLDAILYDILFRVPVTSLARGDAFKNEKIFKLLRRLKMLPVYRIREGAANLNINYDSFDACLELFRQKEAVLIFSEGLCVNEWKLRPLKKGTARLAFQAWDKGLPLHILPAALNYSAFRKHGVRVLINLGDFLVRNDFPDLQTDGQRYKEFNFQLEAQLSRLVLKPHPDNPREFRELFGCTPFWQKCLLALPAAAGAILHLPLYGMTELVTRTWFRKTDHVDSVRFGILLLTYPLYVLLIVGLACQAELQCWWLLILLMPFTAWAYTRFEIRKG
ncbi:hypothetical protein GCM10027051_13090 [Niabella terrae]